MIQLINQLINQSINQSILQEIGTFGIKSSVRQRSTLEFANKEERSQSGP